MITKEKTRTHVYYSGNVQGVGFRYTAMRIAGSYDVAGYVRNMPDGRVELVVEAASRETDAFLAEVTDAMAGYIRDVNVQPELHTGEFVTFELRHW